MRVTRLFPYRVARVVPIRLELPRPLLQELEYALAKATGMHPMNHTVYEIEGYLGEPPGYLWFTDSSVFIGDSIELGHPRRPLEADMITVFDPPRLVDTRAVLPSNAERI